jgi:hypothetical protein
MDRVYLYVGVGNISSYENIDKIDREQSLLGWLRIYLFDNENTYLLENRNVVNYGCYAFT